MSRIALAVVSGCLILSNLSPLAAFAQSSQRLSPDEVSASKHLESVDIVDESTLGHPGMLSGGVSTEYNATAQKGLAQNGMAPVQNSMAQNGMAQNGMGAYPNQMGMAGTQMAANPMQMQMNNTSGMAMNGMNTYQNNGMTNGVPMNGYQNGMGMNAQMNGYGNQMSMNGAMPMNGMYGNGFYANGYANGNDGRALEQAIGVAGTSIMLQTFLSNGGIGGMLRQVGWGDCHFHNHSPSIGGY